MLEIVLFILKIVGIILAVLLGILIVAVCALLFIPVRYRGEFSVADTEGSEKKKAAADIRVTWLFHFVRVLVSYKDTARVRVKILFFTLLDTAKEKKAGKKKQKGTSLRTENAKTDKTVKEKTENKETDKTESKEADKAGSEKAESKEADKAGSGKTESKEADKENTANEGTDKTEEKNTENAEDVEKGKETDDARRKKPGLKERISNILYTIRNFCDKLREIKEKKDKVTKLWMSEHMVKSRSLLGRELLYLLKHTKPRHLEGVLAFGFADPSTTGYAMALYGILYPIWNPKLIVEPDFEKEKLDCQIKLKGKIRAFHFLKTALRLLLSKDVRKVIRDCKAIMSDTPPQEAEKK